MNFCYETDRLLLKILSADSAPETLRFLQSNREGFERYDGEQPDNYYTKRYQETVLTYEFNLTMKNRYFRYWLFEKTAPSKIIGTVSIQRIERGVFQTCSIGYKMDADYRRRGYMAEALRFLTYLIFADLHLHRIEAYVKPENTASICLLKKIGFREEGIAYQSIYINGNWEDHLRFSLISDR